MKQIIKISLITIILTIGSNYTFGQTTLLSEGFENSGSIPTGWTQINENSTNDFTFQDGAGTGSINSAHGGSYNALLFADRGSVTKLVTSVINFSGHTTNPTLTFWHGQEHWDADQDELRIYYKTSSGGSWNPIPAAVWTSNVDELTHRTVTLPDVNSTYYIAFEGTSNYGNGLVIDDVLVEGSSSNDSDSKILVSTNLTEPTTISSLINTQGEKINVFDFTFEDLQSGDGFATIIDLLQITTGATNNVADWTTVIAGARLDGPDQTAMIGTINATDITFAANDMISVAEGSGNKETYTLSIWLSSSVIDNEILDFKIANTSIVCDGAGSTFGTYSVESGSETITVVATKLAFIQQPTDVQQFATMSPSPTVEAIDENGNRDLDYVSDIKVTESAGGMTGSPQTETAVAGLATFGSLSFSTPTIGVTLTAQQNATSDWDVISNAYDITANPCTVTVFPYTQNFDGFATQSAPSCTNNNLPIDDIDGCWYNEQTIDDTEWVVDNDGTASGSTGPEFDHTTGSANYIFIEASSCNSTNAMAISPTFDFAGKTDATMTFYYHMYGSDMGTLQVDLYYNGSWHNAIITTWESTGTDLTSLSGDQTNNWYKGTCSFADACSYSDVKFRFSGTTGGGYASDMAIDDINITVVEAPTVAPDIANVNPDYLFQDKGKQLTLTGTNMQNPSSVTIGGIAGTVVSSNYTTLVVDFPAGDYTGTILTVTNIIGNDTETVDIRSRNIIPVDDDAIPSSDTHSTIQLALDGLYAWYGSTSFDAGDSPGAMTIDVYTGNYTDAVLPNSNLNPSSTNILIIQNHDTEKPEINASGNSYGIKTTIPNVKIQGMYIYSATNNNIETTGANTEICYNKVTTSFGNGIYLTGINSNVHHNLSFYNRSSAIYINGANNTNVESNTTYSNGYGTGALGYTVEDDRQSGTIYDWEYDSNWNKIDFPDDDEENFAYPFPFSFYGKNYTSSDNIGVSSNGAFLMDGVQFEVKNKNTDWEAYNKAKKYAIENGTKFRGMDNALSYTNHSLNNYTTSQWGAYDDYDPPTTPVKTLGTNDANLIAAYWDDMDSDDHGGAIRNATFGTAPFRKFTTVWYQRQHYADNGGTIPGEVSVALKIFESTNIIEFHYKDLVYDNSSEPKNDYLGGATVGIKKNNTTYMQYHYSDSRSHHHDVEGGADDCDPEQGQLDAADGNRELFAIRYTPIGTGSELYIENGTAINIQNNIFYARVGSGDECYTISTEAGVTFTSNYNNFFKNNNDYVVNINGTKSADLTAWGNGGANSIELDPKFVYPGNDFHIRSSATGESYHEGEWPALTANTGANWTADDDVSPSLDAGTGTFGGEPAGNGGIRNQGCYGDTPQATKTSIIIGHWTGATSTEWNNIQNWSDRVVPIISTDATIPDVSTGSNRFPYIEVSAECNNLTIDLGANVQIAPNYSLNVVTTLINSAGNSGLIIKSDATGTGSLIHNTIDIDGTVERFFEAATDPQWHYLSMPVKDVNRTLFTANNFYSYNENTDDYWIGITYEGTSGWENPSGTLTTMKGYIHYNNQITINYEGKLHYDAAGYNYNATYKTGHSGNAPNGQAWVNYDGWNLLGNPYPAAVDWHEVNLVDINKTVYFYDDNTDNYKYYNYSGGTYDNGMSANGGSRYIPVGQGFFVKTDDATDGGTVTLPLASRVHNTQSFWKNENSKEQEENYIRLSTSVGDFNDELVIRVLPDATYSFDGQFDAYKRYSWNADVPQIYSMDIPQSTEYAINTLPEFNNSISIPLGYNINLQGDYFIQLSENKFENINVFIEDKQTNKNIALNELDSYNFNLEAGNCKDRFILHLVKNTASISNISNEISVFPNPANDKFTIQMDFNKTGENKIITLRNISGKVILIKSVKENVTEIDIQKLPVGTYILSVKSNSVFINKIIIKSPK